jgi:hypothetical protein
MPNVEITTGNIDLYRGGLTISPNDLHYEIWDVFDHHAFLNTPHAQVVALHHIVSVKNQLEDPKFLAGLKPDPRSVAMTRMRAAAEGRIPRRVPISVRKADDTRLIVIDGNATAQVLMLAGWKDVPVVLTSA